MFEMQMVAGGSVRAILRVPIVGNAGVSYIEYSRIYYKLRNANIEKNEGGMVEFDFTGLIMPIVRFTNPEDAYYTVFLYLYVFEKFLKWNSLMVLIRLILLQSHHVGMRVTVKQVKLKYIP